MEKIKFSENNSTNLNNNNTDNLENNCDCHFKMIPKDNPGNEAENRLPETESYSNCSAEGGDKAKVVTNQETNPDVGDEILSNRTSVNNSTDNLSYSSDNYYTDEIVVLPNTISDEEISINSDDCVYAYRGGAEFDIVDRLADDMPGNNNEDETDFLEMDFEPDPSSEIDPLSVGIPNVDFPNGESQSKTFVTPNIDDNKLPRNNSHRPISNNPTQPAQSTSNDTNDNDGENSKTKITGAKPKKLLHRSNSQSSSSKASRKISKMQEEDKSNNINCCFRGEPEEACLDCLEKEFLAKTIGKETEIVCYKCKSKRNCISSYKNSSSSSCNTSTNDILRANKSSISFDFNDLMPTDKEDCGFKTDSITHKKYQRQLSFDNFNGEQLIKTTKKETSTFSTNNVEEKTLVQALEKLDINYNADIIKAHFHKANETNFKSITDYILYESKKNCDYKKLIKLIKLACVDEINIKYDMDTNENKLNAVEIKSFEILQYWENSSSKSTDLEKLKKLNKKFVQLNVLGKVINLIRQSKQRNNPKPLGEGILIPQYYRSGYLTIIKE